MQAKWSDPFSMACCPKRYCLHNAHTHTLHCSAFQGISCFLNSDNRSKPSHNTPIHTLDVRNVQEGTSRWYLGRRRQVFVTVTGSLALFPEPSYNKVQLHHPSNKYSVHVCVGVSYFKRCFLE